MNTPSRTSSLLAVLTVRPFPSILQSSLTLNHLELFRHELTKRLVRNNRLEDEYFLTHIGDAGEAREAWSTCPNSLRMAYIQHKFERNNVHACLFSYRIDELLDYHATLNGTTETREQVLEKLFHGVLAIS